MTQVSPWARWVFAGGIGVLALSGCSFGQSKSATTPSVVAVAPPASTSAPAAGATATSGGVVGAAKTVSVASVTLPSDLTWKVEPTTAPANTEAATWVVSNPNFHPSASATSATPVPPVLCRVQLIVQKNVTFTLESQKAVLEGQAGSQLTMVEDTPPPPAGVTGFEAQYRGPGPGSKAAPFVTQMRYWLTPGKTLISLRATSPYPVNSSCDPAAIAATLRWNGSEPK